MGPHMPSRRPPGDPVSGPTRLRFWDTPSAKLNSQVSARYITDRRLIAQNPHDFCSRQQFSLSQLATWEVRAGRLNS